MELSRRVGIGFPQIKTVTPEQQKKFQALNRAVGSNVLYESLSAINQLAKTVKPESN